MAISRVYEAAGRWVDNFLGSVAQLIKHTIAQMKISGEGLIGTGKKKKDGSAEKAL